jgi:hypothetical protein
MSPKDLEVKLKTLGMKNDIAALQAFVSSLEEEKVILMFSVISCVVSEFHYPLLGIGLYRRSRRLLHFASPCEVYVIL